MSNISAAARQGRYLSTRRSINNAATRRGRDRLSELPDDILLNILERLDTLDALRTCILSKRLMRLPAMLSRFDIDIGSLMCYHDMTPHDFDTDHITHYNNVVAGVTEKIMCAKSLETSIIHELMVVCYLRPNECLPIIRAIASIMATHKVDTAELLLLVEKPFSQCTPNDLLCYAKRFNTCLGDCPAAFAGLTRLSLDNMRFAGMDITNILSICKRLEYLCLSYCDAGVGSVLHVEHDHLVELIVETWFFKTVHLNHVPKLQCLELIGWWYPESLTFGYVPHLSTLSLAKVGTSYTMNLQLSRLLANVPSIRYLRLDFTSEKIWVVRECSKLIAPVFRKLLIVNLEGLPERCDIAWTMFILEAAPSLRELCMTVWDHRCNMVTDKDVRRKYGLCEKANVEWQPSASGFKHMNLVKLTIHGFQQDENMVRYVRRITEVALNVRVISLHDRKACDRCGELDPKVNVCPSSYPITNEEKDMLMLEMTKGLGFVASPCVIQFRS